MAKFLGFQQVLQSDYDKLDRVEKLNFMWLVRESKEDNAPAAIYFGTRKYADVSSASTVVNLSGASGITIEDGIISVDYDTLDYDELAYRLNISGGTVDLTEIYEELDDLDDRVSVLEEKDYSIHINGDDNANETPTA